MFVLSYSLCQHANRSLILDPCSLLAVIFLMLKNMMANVQIEKNPRRIRRATINNYS